MLNSYSQLAAIGKACISSLEELGRMGIFFSHTARHLFAPPWEFKSILQQLRFVGSRSVIVIAVAGVFVGMVVALQFHDTLVRFGSVSLLGSAVGLSLVRELGPVLTALIIVGRVGSATCAELGIMRTDNQIDAIECMAIDPYRYLLLPRFMAFLIAAPLLTAIFDVVGIFGGWFVAVVVFKVNQGAYFTSMADTVLLADLTMGITKSIIFGVLTAWICMAKGFLMHQNHGMVFGAEGVSSATTAAVVVASISILYADFAISALML